MVQNTRFWYKKLTFGIKIPDFVPKRRFYYQNPDFCTRTWFFAPKRWFWYHFRSKPRTAGCLMAAAQGARLSQIFFFHIQFVISPCHSVLFLGNPPQKLKILYTSNILYLAKTRPYNYSTYWKKYENNSSLEVSPKFQPFFVFFTLNPMWIFTKNDQNFGQTIGNELFPYFSRYVGYL